MMWIRCEFFILCDKYDCHTREIRTLAVPLVILRIVMHIPGTIRLLTLIRMYSVF